MLEIAYFFESLNHSTPLVRMHQVILMRFLFFVTCTIWGFQISHGFVDVEEAFQDGRNQFYIKTYCQLMSLHANFTILEDNGPTEYSYR